MNLKQEVEQVHKQAEQTQLSQKLVNGTISEYEYSQYLAAKLLITNVIENKIDLHQDTKRYYKVLHDIRAIDQQFSANLYPKEALEYSQYINSLPIDKVCAHLYVNYLGDMYGGQYIAKNLKFPCTHLSFDNMVTSITEARGYIAQEQWFADEAKTAFNWIIKVYDSIQP